MTTFLIKNTALDSSNWVKINGVSFIPGYKRQTSADPLNGSKQPTIPEGLNIGLSSPQLSIIGFIDVDEFTSAELYSTTPSTLTGTFEDGTSKTGYMTLGNNLYSRGKFIKGIIKRIFKGMSKIGRLEHWPEE